MRKAVSLLMVLIQIVAMALTANGEKSDIPPYQETILSVPEGDYLWALDQEPGGAIIALSEGEDGAYHFLRWTELEGPPEVIPLPAMDLRPWGLDIAMDGEILLYASEHLQSADDDAAEATAKADSACFYIWVDASGQEISRFAIDGDGILAPTIAALPGRRVAYTDSFGMNDLVICDENGEKIHSLPPVGAQKLQAGADTLYAFGSGSVFSWSLETYERLPTRPIAWRYFGQTAIGADGEIYMIEDGVYELLLADGVVEKRMDSLGTCLGDQDMRLNSFCALPGGVFVLHLFSVATQTIGDRVRPATSTIAVYRPLEEIKNRTPFVITSMRNASSLIEKAASEFQKQHPELEVKLRVLNNYQITGGMLRDDLIRIVNTELLAGGGGDVLLVDSLPVKPMIARGMLRDLSHLMSEASLLPGIAESSKSPDGKVYAIPAEFGVILLWGRKEAIDSINTFTDILKAPIDPDQARLPSFAWEYNLGLYLASCMRDFLDEQGRFSFDSEEFIAFLETLYQMHSEIDVSPNLDFQAQYDNEQIALRNGNIALYPVEMHGFFSVGMYYAFFGEEEARAILMPSMHAAGGAYVPDTLLSIPTSAKDAALSEAFIRLVLSEDMLTTQALTKGFSTDSRKLDRVFADELERSRDPKRNKTSIFYPDGREDVLIAPGEDFLMDLRAQMDQLFEPLDFDETILGFIVEETKPFFEGSISAEAAARAIEQRAWLYLHE